MWSNKSAVDCPANGRGPLGSFDLKGSKGTLSGFDDVSQMLGEIDTFAGDGKAEVSVRIDEGNDGTVESEFEREPSLKGQDTALGDVVDHAMLLCPKFGDADESFGGVKIGCEEDTIVGVEEAARDVGMIETIELGDQGIDEEIEDNGGKGRALRKSTIAGYGAG